MSSPKSLHITHSCLPGLSSYTSLPGLPQLLLPRRGPWNEARPGVVLFVVVSITTCLFSLFSSFFFFWFEHNCTPSGKKLVTGVVTASQVQSIECRWHAGHFVLPTTDCWADPLEALTSMVSKQQRHKLWLRLTIHSVEAWLEWNKGLELCAESSFHGHWSEVKLIWYYMYLVAAWSSFTPLTNQICAKLRPSLPRFYLARFGLETRLAALISWVYIQSH